MSGWRLGAEGLAGLSGERREGPETAPEETGLEQVAEATGAHPVPGPFLCQQAHSRAGGPCQTENYIPVPLQLAVTNETQADLTGWDPLESSIEVGVGT